jgi:quercetin dioxygenase-like cupin family protein
MFTHRSLYHSIVIELNASIRAGLGAAIALVALAAAPAAWSSEQAHIAKPGDAELEWGPCPDFMPETCGIAVLQGDPAKRNSDVFFRLQGGTEAPHHWHSSAERMVLVEGHMRVNYDGQDPVDLHPGTYAYGPAEHPHVATCLSEEPCVLFIAFEEPVDAFAVK